MLTGHASGLLLHPTSLPNSYGIGDLGSGAIEFLDWLAAARQRVWQVLPLGPTAAGDSPYQSPSAFAGNPLLISLDLLAADGLLDPGELRHAIHPDGIPTWRLDFEDVRRRKLPLLETATRRLISTRGHLTRDYESFCSRQAHWLESFASFMSLREANQRRAWCDWREFVDERRQPLDDWPDRETIQDLHRGLQFLFFRQWHQLRSEAHRRGILLVGDVPIYVSYDCADVWSQRQYFQLDDSGRPTRVAGVPPDYFSTTGQLWNNPLYDWDALKQDNYRWWISRLKTTLELVDLVRLDHFRGFEAFWSVPAGESTAIHGDWVPGPGADFLSALSPQLAPAAAARFLLDGLPIIAEDLGMITAPVHELRRQFGLPGMNVLQFILPGESHDRPNLQAFDPNTVVYTGTHDNDTTLGWYRTEILPHLDRRERLRYWADCDEHRLPWRMVELAWEAASHLAVAPVQDVLGLGTEARMNTPGTFGEEFANWQWRLLPGQLTSAAADALAELTLATGRAGGMN